MNMSEVGVLECNVKLPPGYTDFDSKNLLAAGETVSLHFAFLVAEGHLLRHHGAGAEDSAPGGARSRVTDFRKHVDLVMLALAGSPGSGMPRGTASSITASCGVIRRPGTS